MTYVEFIYTTMFLAAYVATVLLIREERPPLRRLALMLIVVAVRGVGSDHSLRQARSSIRAVRSRRAWPCAPSNTRGAVVVADSCTAGDYAQLGQCHQFAAHHFGGENLYLNAVRRNVDYAGHPSPQLRRQPPCTLLPEVQPYPRDLVRIQ